MFTSCGIHCSNNHIHKRRAGWVEDCGRSKHHCVGATLMVLQCLLFLHCMLQVEDFHRENQRLLHQLRSLSIRSPTQNHASSIHSRPHHLPITSPGGPFIFVVSSSSCVFTLSIFVSFSHDSSILLPSPRGQQGHAPQSPWHHTSQTDTHRRPLVSTQHPPSAALSSSSRPGDSYMGSQGPSLSPLSGS